MAMGANETPTFHRALSLKAKAERAERQIAIQLAAGNHMNYGALRKRLKSRPPIREVELELPYFWQELRRKLAA